MFCWCPKKPTRGGATKRTKCDVKAVLAVTRGYRLKRALDPPLLRGSGRRSRRTFDSDAGPLRDVLDHPALQRAPGVPVMGARGEGGPAWRGRIALDTAKTVAG